MKMVKIINSLYKYMNLSSSEKMVWLIYAKKMANYEFLANVKKLFFEYFFVIKRI